MKRENANVRLTQGDFIQLDRGKRKSREQRDGGTDRETERGRCARKWQEQAESSRVSVSEREKEKECVRK